MENHDQNWLDVTTSRGRHIKVLAKSHPRARRLSLTLGIDGPRVSAPKGTLKSEMKAFLQENADWLEQKLRAMERLGIRLAPPRPGVPDTLNWRGQILLATWEYATFPHARLDEHQIAIALDLEHPEADIIARRAMRAFFVAQMKREVGRLVDHYAPLVGKSIVSTRLLPMKTLWGSLSVRGRMTLDLSLILAPLPALAYVVVHEMCHLWVRNHGKRFWRHVEEIYPQHLETRHWLSQNGHALKAELGRWIGADLP